MYWNSTQTVWALEKLWEKRKSTKQHQLITEWLCRRMQTTCACQHTLWNYTVMNADKENDEDKEMMIMRPKVISDKLSCLKILPNADQFFFQAWKVTKGEIKTHKIIPLG